MDTVRLNAHAKLNLTLDITGREESYHTIDSLAVSIDLCDRIVLRKRKDALSFVTMHGMGSETLPPEKNNALKAAEMFSKAFGVTGANITIYKNIPMGAGLGGSSADAAGVLLGMKELYGVSDMGVVNSLADALGSDTKFLLSGGLARMQGRGTELTFFEDVPEYYALILCPRHGVSSAACYRKYDELARTHAPCTEEAAKFLLAGESFWAARYCSNHLYDAAVALEPEIADALLSVKGFSPLGAAMTGSGSAVFALFPTRELAAWAKSRYTGRCRAIVAATSYREKSIKNPFVLSDGETGG